MIARLLLILLFSLGGLVASAAEVSPEDQKIEKLLGVIAARQDVEFIRNGSTHDSATAAKFLRGKWDRQRADIKTAADFIEKIATKSSTTGQPYRLRFKDGHEVDCADFLRARLAELVAK